MNPVSKTLIDLVPPPNASGTQYLYSSDAFGLPEFVYLGALLFRRALDSVLRGWVSAGDCTDDIAEQIRTAVCAGNANRLYRLTEQSHLEETG